MNSSGGLGMPDGNPVEEPDPNSGGNPDCNPVEEPDPNSGGNPDCEGKPVERGIRWQPRFVLYLGKTGVWEESSLGRVGLSKRSRENGSLIRRLTGKTGVWR